MRKEVILAVIIGVILGGVILYGLNLANNSSSPKNTSDSSATNQDVKVTPTPSKEGQTVSITIPQDHAVVTEEKTTLKGTAKPNSNIAIITENDDIITTSDTNGNFSSDITLISGENKITVTAVDSSQATSSASITVIHTASLPE